MLGRQESPLPIVAEFIELWEQSCRASREVKKTDNVIVTSLRRAKFPALPLDRRVETDDVDALVEVAQ